METGWDISVLVEDLQVTRRIRVRGDTHIGGVMLKLVESIEVKKDWSDHGLWWPDEKRWLLKNRVTLDQAGVYSDARLEFLPMHGTVWLQLPDLQERPMKISFAQSVFSVVVSLCRELGIRYPEELSLRRRFAPSHSPGSANGTLGFGSRFGSFRRSKSVKSPSQIEVRAAASANGGSSGYNTMLGRQTSQASNARSPLLEGLLASPVSINSLVFENAEKSLLANSPHVSAQAAFVDKGLARLKTFAERAAFNEAWLDSSLSLMEQGVRPGNGYDDQASLQLRYKFLSFYDINVKYDVIRINQIYEQLKWSVISEELDCTEEEALLLAALQLQIRLSSEGPSSPMVGTASRAASTLNRKPTLDQADGRDEKVDDDDIDAALAELEASLMSDAFLTLGSPKRNSESRSPQSPLHSPQSPGLTKMPELVGYLKFFKPRKYSTIRGYRRYFFVLTETQLFVYPDQTRARIIEQFSLLSSQLTPNVSAATHKFGIRLFVPDTETPGGQLQELWLRCDTKEQYAEWTAGLRLAARGKSLASKGEFEAEVQATATQLELQAPKPQPRLSLDSAPPIEPEDFVPPRHQKSRKPRWLIQQIVDRHANVRDRSLIDAKLDYIKVCQRLPTYGIAYFVVQCFCNLDQLNLHEFHKSRGGSGAKEELVAVASNRLMRLELPSGKIVNTWRFEELESWTVRWDINSLELKLSRAQNGLVFLPCASSMAVSKKCLCKALAEFIGGYAFMSLRRPEKSQELNEQFFHQLTAYREQRGYR